MKPILFLTGFLLFVLPGNSQNTDKEPEHEIALGLKVITGKIQYGSNQFYVTDPQSIGILPAGVRYDYPVKISRNNAKRQYISLMGTAGFLFCKARKFDSLYFHPKNPAYFTVSAGAYTMSSFSVGAELFFWKGLGNRDLFGAKFLSIGLNAKNFRLYASGEWYAQLINTRMNGTLFSVDFFWKLIKGGADRPGK